MTALDLLARLDCPDCGTPDAIGTHDHCTVCGLAFEDVLAAADFFDGLIATPIRRD